MTDTLELLGDYGGVNPEVRGSPARLAQEEVIKIRCKFKD